MPFLCQKSLSERYRRYHLKHQKTAPLSHFWLYDAVFNLVRGTRLELAWYNHTPLKRARLPIPPSSHIHAAFVPRMIFYHTMTIKVNIVFCFPCVAKTLRPEPLGLAVPPVAAVTLGKGGNAGKSRGRSPPSLFFSSAVQGYFFDNLRFVDGLGQVVVHAA